MLSVVLLASPRIANPLAEISPPLLFVIVTPSELLKLIALLTLVEIVPEFVTVNSPPSVDIVLAPVDVIAEPECIVSVVPVTSPSVFLIAFWPVLVMEALSVKIISTSFSVTTCWAVASLDMVVSSSISAAYNLLEKI